MHTNLTPCILPWQFGNGGPRGRAARSPRSLAAMTYVTGYEDAGVKYLARRAPRPHLAIFMQPQVARGPRRSTAARRSSAPLGPPAYFHTGLLTAAHGRPARWAAAGPRHDGVQRRRRACRRCRRARGRRRAVLARGAASALGTALSITLVGVGGRPGPRVHGVGRSRGIPSSVVADGVPRRRREPRQARVDLHLRRPPRSRASCSRRGPRHLPAAAPLADRDRAGLRDHRALDDDVHGHVRARLDAHLPRAVLQGLEGHPWTARPPAITTAERRVPADRAAGGRARSSPSPTRRPSRSLAWLAVAHRAARDRRPPRATRGSAGRRVELLRPTAIAATLATPPRRVASRGADAASTPAAGRAPRAAAAGRAPAAGPLAAGRDHWRGPAPRSDRLR